MKVEVRKGSMDESYPMDKMMTGTFAVITECPSGVLSGVGSIVYRVATSSADYPYQFIGYGTHASSGKGYRVRNLHTDEEIVITKD